MFILPHSFQNWISDLLGRKVTMLPGPKWVVESAINEIMKTGDWGKKYFEEMKRFTKSNGTYNNFCNYIDKRPPPSFPNVASVTNQKATSASIPSNSFLDKAVLRPTPFDEPDDVYDAASSPVQRMANNIHTADQAIQCPMSQEQMNEMATQLAGLEKTLLSRLEREKNTNPDRPMYHWKNLVFTTFNVLTQIAWAPIKWFMTRGDVTATNLVNGVGLLTAQTTQYLDNVDDLINELSKHCNSGNTTNTTDQSAQILEYQEFIRDLQQLTDEQADDIERYGQEIDKLTAEFNAIQK
jgi:hypothetical protein